MAPVTTAPVAYSGFTAAWWVPVAAVGLVSAGSEVVAWHVKQTGAGLLYADRDEFARHLRFLADAPAEAARTAAGGRAYVLENYRWDAVLDRVEAALDAWTTAPGCAS